MSQNEESTSGNPWQEIDMPSLDLSIDPLPVEQNPTQEFLPMAEQAALTIQVGKNALSDLQLPEHLGHLKETYLHLPERLEFQPGITLMFGENGSGKSTLTRAVKMATKVEELYQWHLNSGTSEEHARRFADSELELPKSRGTSFEEFIKAGLSPLIAKCLTVTELVTETPILYADMQEMYGHKTRGLSEMSGYTSYREGRGGGFESRGNTFSNDDLQRFANDSMSARQTVDEVLGDFLEASFGSYRRLPRDMPTDYEGLDWEIPEELIRKQPKRDSTGLSELVRGREPRKRKYYAGIAFVDEPETGLSPRRHLGLPDRITRWCPPGSILVVPTNSTELFRSDLPRIDLDQPERGIHRP